MLSHFRANSVAISLILATAAVAVLSAALWAARAASRLRTLSNASIGVLGFTMRSFLRLRLGEMGCVFSRVNTNRRSMSPHSNTPACVARSRGPTWCRLAPPASHTFLPRTLSIASQLLPFNAAYVGPHPSCASFENIQARTASRQGAPPLSHV
jgi:hypothetical protein